MEAKAGRRREDHQGVVLDAESTLKWESSPALDALADPGGGIKRGGGNLSGGPATTDAGIKKTASRPSPTRTRTSRVVGNHAKRPSPYPHLVSSLDKEGETRRGGRPSAAGKREGRHQQTTRRAVPDDHVRVGNVEGRASVEAAWPAQRQHAADRDSESIGNWAEP